MNHKLIFALFFIYIAIMTALMVILGIGIAPDRYAFLLIFPAFLIRKFRPFLFDWIPFLFILISYDFLRSFAPNLNPRVHYIELINFDTSLFHTLPTAWLQANLYNPNALSFIDILATLSYFLHFALPLAFGFLLWMTSRVHFRLFVIAILLLSYLGWISFVIFPSAPPWLAQQNGYIFGVTKILDQTLDVFPEKVSLPTIYHQINPNPVAAFPSMHVAYPALIFLFCLKFYGKKGLWFLPYLLLVIFSLVYLGEHYFVDALGGIIFALAIFYFTLYLQRFRFFKASLNSAT